MVLSETYQVILFVLNNILLTSVNLIILINLYLFWGFIKRQCGRRVEPDGRKAIIITGATSGFGLVMARYFYNLGFTIIATYYNKLELGYKELSEISSKNDLQDEETQNDGHGRKLLKKKYFFLVPLDVSSKESIKEAKTLIDESLDKYKLELFCLVNNAGIASDGPFQWINPDSMVKVVETNLLGVMMLTREFIFRIIKNRGRVVNVSSGLHAIPCVTTSIYGSTKSGVAHFSDALDLDIKRYGASCRCVVPGNLMASTNIIFTRIRGARNAIDSLSDEERSFYDKSIRRCLAVFAMIARDANETSAMSAEELKNIYGVTEEQINRNVKKRGFLGRVAINIGNFISGSIGQGSESKIERSYVTKSFDDAVRLIYCPSRVYTGNFVYTNYFGPMMDLLPYELIHATIELLMGNK